MFQNLSIISGLLAELWLPKGLVNPAAQINFTSLSQALQNNVPIILSVSFSLSFKSQLYEVPIRERSCPLARVCRVTLACHIPVGRLLHAVVFPELDSYLYSVLLHKTCLISLLQALAIPQNFTPQEHHMNRI